MATLDFSQYAGCPMEVGEPLRVFHQGAKRGLLGLRVIILAAMLTAVGYVAALSFDYGWSQLDGSSLLLIVILGGGVVFIVFAGVTKAMSYVREWRDMASVHRRPDDGLLVGKGHAVAGEPGSAAAG